MELDCGEIGLVLRILLLQKKAIMILSGAGWLRQLLLTPILPNKDIFTENSVYSSTFIRYEEGHGKLILTREARYVRTILHTDFGKK